MTDKLEDLLARIDRCHVPHLRQDAVVVAARLWSDFKTESKPDSKFELDDEAAIIKFLDEFMGEEFPKYFAHAVEFAKAGAVGEGRISNELSGRQSFSSDEAYETAYALWEEYNHQPGPWESFGNEKRSVAWILNYKYGWTVNDWKYELPNVPIEEDKATRIARVEAERKSRYDQLTTDVMTTLTDRVSIFRTDQLLENAEDHDWICYHDEVFAVAAERHFIILYYGFDGYWG